MTRDEAAIERMARACEGEMFADHERPVDPELHDKYRETIRTVLAALLADPPPAVERAVIARLREPSDAMEKAGLHVNVLVNRQKDGTPGCPGVINPMPRPDDWRDPANFAAVKAYIDAPHCRIARAFIPPVPAWQAMIDARLAELDAEEERDG